MTEQQNVQSIQDAYAAFGRGDIQGILAHLDEQIEWTVSGPSQIRLAGTRRGHAGVLDFFKCLAEDEETVAFEPRMFVAQGDMVVVRGHYAWRVRATGRVAESDFAHFFTMRDGKAATFFEFSDTAKLAEAYGLTPVGATS